MAQIGPVTFDNARALAVIAGPCVIEEESVFAIAESLKRCATERGFGLVFKASFDKANRQAFDSPRGCGLDRGLEILAEIKKRFDLPVLTDIHLPDEAARVAAVADCLQIPAFLCRQTDLVVAAARTGRPVNIKKGQFLAPEQMRFVVEKARSAGAADVLVTERGATFGYGDLVFDPRSLVVMRDFAPVIFDATHSVQRPASGAGQSGGDRRFVPALAAAAAAVGIAGLFVETHPDPAQALSDRETQWPLAGFPAFIDPLLKLDRVVKC